MAIDNINDPWRNEEEEPEIHAAPPPAASPDQEQAIAPVEPAEQAQQPSGPEPNEATARNLARIRDVLENGTGATRGLTETGELAEPQETEPEPEAPLPDATPNQEPPVDWSNIQPGEGYDNLIKARENEIAAIKAKLQYIRRGGGSAASQELGDDRSIDAALNGYRLREDFTEEAGDFLGRLEQHVDDLWQKKYDEASGFEKWLNRAKVANSMEGRVELAQDLIDVASMGTKYVIGAGVSDEELAKLAERIDARGERRQLSNLSNPSDEMQLADIRSFEDTGKWFTNLLADQSPIIVDSMVGAAAGAAVGSIFPVVGTAIGGGVGLVGGVIRGAFVKAGEKAGISAAKKAAFGAAKKKLVGEIARKAALREAARAAASKPTQAAVAKRVSAEIATLAIDFNYNLSSSLEAIRNESLARGRDELDLGQAFMQASLRTVADYANPIRKAAVGAVAGKSVNAAANAGIMHTARSWWGAVGAMGRALAKDAGWGAVSFEGETLADRITNYAYYGTPYLQGERSLSDALWHDANSIASGAAMAFTGTANQYRAAMANRQANMAADIFGSRIAADDIVFSRQRSARDEAASPSFKRLGIKDQRLICAIANVRAKMEQGATLERNSDAEAAQRGANKRAAYQTEYVKLKKELSTEGRKWLSAYESNFDQNGIGEFERAVKGDPTTAARLASDLAPDVDYDAMFGAFSDKNGNVDIKRLTKAVVEAGDGGLAIQQGNVQIRCAFEENDGTLNFSVTRTDGGAMPERFCTEFCVADFSENGAQTNQAAAEALHQAVTTAQTLSSFAKWSTEQDAHVVEYANRLVAGTGRNVAIVRTIEDLVNHLRDKKDRKGNPLISIRQNGDVYLENERVSGDLPNGFSGTWRGYTTPDGKSIVVPRSSFSNYLELAAILDHESFHSRILELIDDAVTNGLNNVKKGDIDKSLFGRENTPDNMRRAIWANILGEDLSAPKYFGLDGAAIDQVLLSVEEGFAFDAEGMVPQKMRVPLFQRVMQNMPALAKTISIYLSEKFGQSPRTQEELADYLFTVMSKTKRDGESVIYGVPGTVNAEEVNGSALGEEENTSTSRDLLAPSSDRGSTREQAGDRTGRVADTRANRKSIAQLVFDAFRDGKVETKNEAMARRLVGLLQPMGVEINNARVENGTWKFDVNQAQVAELLFTALSRGQESQEAADVAAETIVNLAESMGKEVGLDEDGNIVGVFDVGTIPDEGAVEGSSAMPRRQPAPKQKKGLIEGPKERTEKPKEPARKTGPTEADRIDMARQQAPVAPKSDTAATAAKNGPRAPAKPKPTAIERGETPAPRGEGSPLAKVDVGEKKPAEPPKPKTRTDANGKRTLKKPEAVAPAAPAKADAAPAQQSANVPQPVEQTAPAPAPEQSVPAAKQRVSEAVGKGRGGLVKAASDLSGINVGEYLVDDYVADTSRAKPHQPQTRYVPSEADYHGEMPVHVGVLAGFASERYDGLTDEEQQYNTLRSINNSGIAERMRDDLEQMSDRLKDDGAGPLSDKDLGRALALYAWMADQTKGVDGDFGEMLSQASDFMDERGMDNWAYEVTDRAGDFMEAMENYAERELGVELYDGEARKPEQDEGGAPSRFASDESLRTASHPSGVQKSADVNYPDAGAEIASARFASIGSQRKAEMGRLLAKHRPDLNADEVVAELEKFGTVKEQKAAIHWVIRGGLALPQDAYKVADALSVAEKAKVDPFRYKSPDELLLANKDFKPSARPIDPATVPELSDARDEGDGIVSYLVQDDRQGQAAMRRVIDTHWGEDANPWCLLAKGEERSEAVTTDDFERWLDDNAKRLHDEGVPPLEWGNIYTKETGEGGTVFRDVDAMKEAWRWWQNYSALPKRVAFKNGRLLAFMATERGQGAGKVEFSKPENERRVESFYKEYSKIDKDERPGNFQQWMMEEHPEEYDAIAEDEQDGGDAINTYQFSRPAEEWWDRKDESHPDLDWAKASFASDQTARFANMDTLRKANPPLDSLLRYIGNNLTGRRRIFQNPAHHFQIERDEESPRAAVRNAIRFIREKGFPEWEIRDALRKEWGSGSVVERELIKQMVIRDERRAGKNITYTGWKLGEGLSTRDVDAFNETMKEVGQPTTMDGAFTDIQRVDYVLDEKGNTVERRVPWDDTTLEKAQLATITRNLLNEANDAASAMLGKVEFLTDSELKELDKTFAAQTKLQRLYNRLTGVKEENAGSQERSQTARVADSMARQPDRAANGLFSVSALKHNTTLANKRFDAISTAIRSSRENKPFGAQPLEDANAEAKVQKLVAMPAMGGRMSLAEAIAKEDATAGVWAARSAIMYAEMSPKSELSGDLVRQVDARIARIFADAFPEQADWLDPKADNKKATRNNPLKPSQILAWKGGTMLDEVVKYELGPEGTRDLGSLLLLGPENDVTSYVRTPVALDMILRALEQVAARNEGVPDAVFERIDALRHSLERIVLGFSMDVKQPRLFEIQAVRGVRNVLAEKFPIRDFSDAVISGEAEEMDRRENRNEKTRKTPVDEMLNAVEEGNGLDEAGFDDGEENRDTTGESAEMAEQRGLDEMDAAQSRFASDASLALADPNLVAAALYALRVKNEDGSFSYSTRVADLLRYTRVANADPHYTFWEAKTDFGKVMAAAKAVAQSDPGALQAAVQEALSAWDTTEATGRRADYRTSASQLALLRANLVMRQAEVKEATDALFEAEAKSDGSVNIQDLRAAVAEKEALLSQAVHATAFAESAAGTALGSLSRLVKEDLSLGEQMRQAEKVIRNTKGIAAENRGPLTAAEIAKLKETASKYEKVCKERDALLKEKQEGWRKEHVDGKIEEGVREARKNKTAGRKEKTVAEAVEAARKVLEDGEMVDISVYPELWAQIGDAVKGIAQAIIGEHLDGPSKLKALDHAEFAKRLLAETNRAYEGRITSRDKNHQQLTERDVLDLYSDYAGPEKLQDGYGAMNIDEGRRREANNRLRELSRLRSALEDIKAGRPPLEAYGHLRNLEPAQVDEELARVRKELDEAFRQSGISTDLLHRQMSPLDLARESLERRIEEIKKNLAAGEIAKKEGRGPLVGEEGLASLREELAFLQSVQNATFKNRGLTDNDRMQKIEEMYRKREKAASDELLRLMSGGRPAKPLDMSDDGARSAWAHADAEWKKKAGEARRAAAAASRNLNELRKALQSESYKGERALEMALARKEDLIVRWQDALAANRVTLVDTSRNGKFDKYDQRLVEVNRQLKNLVRQKNERIAQIAFDRKNKFAQVVSKIWQAPNLQRIVQASGDLSSIGVQCAVAVLANPIHGMRAVIPGIKAFWGGLVNKPEYTEAFFEKLRQDPDFNRIADFVAIPETDGKGGFLQGGTEEFFNRKAVQDRFPKLFGYDLFDNAYLRASEAGFNVPVALIRFSLAKKLIQQMRTFRGENYKPTDEEMRLIGNVVNAATGKGKWLADGSKVNLSGLLWAASRVSGQVESLAIVPRLLAHGEVGQDVRMMIGKELILRPMLHFTEAMLLLGLAHALFKDDDDDDPFLVVDPRSSKFLRAKIGNRYISITGGLEQYVVLLTKAVTGQVKTKDGEIIKLRGEGAAYGRAWSDELWRMFKSKIRPDIGIAMQLFDAKTATGKRIQPTWFGKDGRLLFLVNNTVMPLTARDIIEAGVDIGENGIGATTALASIAVLGYNGSDFGENAYTKDRAKVDRVAQARRDMKSGKEGAAEKYAAIAGQDAMQRYISASENKRVKKIGDRITELDELIERGEAKRAKKNGPIVSRRMLTRQERKAAREEKERLEAEYHDLVWPELKRIR